jgi:hypothetical protein
MDFFRACEIGDGEGDLEGLPARVRRPVATSYTVLYPKFHRRLWTQPATHSQFFVFSQNSRLSYLATKI